VLKDTRFWIGAAVGAAFVMVVLPKIRARKGGGGDKG
jgi:hypothetical protein